MKDKYDEEVERMTENPRDIERSWRFGELLFAFVRPTGEQIAPAWCGHKKLGCLTLIRSSRQFVAWTPELTDAIRRDGRIPKEGEDITPAHLPVFARWQRRIDKELGRT